MLKCHSTITEVYINANNITLTLIIGDVINFIHLLYPWAKKLTTYVFPEPSFPGRHLAWTMGPSCQCIQVTHSVHWCIQPPYKAILPYRHYRSTQSPPHIVHIWTDLHQQEQLLLRLPSLWLIPWGENPGKASFPSASAPLSYSFALAYQLRDGLRFWLLAIRFLVTWQSIWLPCSSWDLKCMPQVLHCLERSP